MIGEDKMELYLHIPFCVRKCNYCDFLSMPADRETMKRYGAALRHEICYYAANLMSEANPMPEAHPVSGSETASVSAVETIYFGGGTPSLLGAEALVGLLDCIRAHYSVSADAEITVEINPATIGRDGLRMLYENGVNRLSIGLQSTDDKELRLLGRVHTYRDFLDVFAAAREVGFQNINADLISALPGQTTEAYLNSLEGLIALKPEHISSYSLMIEEGTPFYQSYGGRPELLPDEETDREMYHLTKLRLREAGYERYEISNYARPGFASKHNSGYWKRTPYLGVGLGASSFWNHIRRRNIGNLQEYLQIWEKEKNRAEHGTNPNGEITENGTDKGKIALCGEDCTEFYEEYELLSLREEMAEYLYLGLRMSEGVSIGGFAACFGQKLSDVYGKELAGLQKDGLLTVDEEKDRVWLTDYGMDVSNYVFEKFV